MPCIVVDDVIMYGELVAVIVWVEPVPGVQNSTRHLQHSGKRRTYPPTSFIAEVEIGLSPSQRDNSRTIKMVNERAPRINDSSIETNDGT